MAIIDKDGCISLAKLSKFNGKTELENAKMIVQILAYKAEFSGIPQTVRFNCEEKIEELKERNRV